MKLSFKLQVLLEFLPLQVVYSLLWSLFLNFLQFEKLKIELKNKYTDKKLIKNAYSWLGLKNGLQEITFIHKLENSCLNLVLKNKIVSKIIPDILSTVLFKCPNSEHDALLCNNLSTMEMKK